MIQSKDEREEEGKAIGPSLNNPKPLSHKGE